MSGGELSDEDRLALAQNIPDSALQLLGDPDRIAHIVTTVTGDDRVHVSRRADPSENGADMVKCLGSVLIAIYDKDGVSPNEVALRASSFATEQIALGSVRATTIEEPDDE